MAAVYSRDEFPLLNRNCARHNAGAFPTFAETMLHSPENFLKSLFQAALAAADPLRVVPPHLPAPPKGRTVAVGAGKAAAAMAKAVEEHWAGPLEGLVVTRYGHGLPCSRIEVVEAAHPVPDAAGRAAAARILERVRGLTADDLVLVLISGGGSALLTLPAPGLTLEDKQATVRALLKSGAAIGEMNTVRKHLSAIKGGRLALAAAPARLVTLAISDVPGDDLSVVASGPTVPDASSFADARAVLEKYRIAAPEAVRRYLKTAADETPKPGDPRLAHASSVLVSRPQDCLLAAADAAWRSGVTPLILGDALEGEAREVGRVMAGIALSVRRHARPIAPPAVLLSGGETTVTVTGQGRGGRNLEFLLALGIALDGAQGIHALAADTDGIDGTEEVAGAVLAPATLDRAREQGLDPKLRLRDNDAWPVFAAASSLIETGPTRTNVNDFRAIFIER
jgi:glycerate 2-kinase